MKRDILDDYRDFLLREHDKLIFQVIPTVARVDEDGDIKQNFLLKMIIPGVGVAQGAAVTWIKPEFFHHGEYDEPCQTKVVFHALHIPEWDDEEQQEDLPVDAWDPSTVPPDPGLEDIDDNLSSWLNGIDGLCR